MFKVKIVVVGPCQSGKTTIANFLADATEQSSGDYHPTQGCRILEFETNVNAGSKSMVEVEMWDCSGDRKFEACWPAIARDSNGVLFVYNPDMPNHDKDMDMWYDFFVSQQNLKESQCIVFAHAKPGAGDRQRSHLSDYFNNMRSVSTNIDDDGEEIRANFSRYLSTLMAAMTDKREQEELNIINH